MRNGLKFLAKFPIFPLEKPSLMYSSPNRFLGLFACLFCLSTFLNGQVTFKPLDDNKNQLEKIVSPSPDLSYAFSLTVADSTPAGLQISVSAFEGYGEETFPVEWTVNGEPGDESARWHGKGPFEVVLQARLMRSGLYRCTIGWTYRGKEQQRVLTVERPRGELGVQVLGLEAAAGRGFWMLIQDTLGQGATLYPPQLAGLALKGDNNSRLQAHFRGVELLDENGQLLADSLLRIPPAGSKRLYLQVDGLRASGEYAGTLQVAAPDAAAVQYEVNLFVKKGWLLAALFIGLGVALSYLMRYYSTQERPKLVNKRRIIDLKGDLDGLKTSIADWKPEEKRVLLALENRLDALYKAVDWGEGDDPDQSIREIDLKLSLIPQWIYYRRMVEELKPAELRPGFVRKLKTVETFLLGKLPAEEEIKAAQETLSKFEEEIEEARLNWMLEQIDAFEQKAKEKMTELDEAQQAAFQKEVMSMTAAAKTACQDKNLEKAGKMMEEAAKAYSRYENFIPSSLLDATRSVDGESAATETRRSRRNWPTVEELSGKLFWYDFAFTAVVALIAVLLGLNLLWVGDTTWGDAQDVLTAVLWGLGLHTVGNQAFQGVFKLKEELGSSSGDAN